MPLLAVFRGGASCGVVTQKRAGRIATIGARGCFAKGFRSHLRKAVARRGRVNPIDGAARGANREAGSRRCAFGSFRRAVENELDRQAVLPPVLPARLELSHAPSRHPAPATLHARRQLDAAVLGGSLGFEGRTAEPAGSPSLACSSLCHEPRVAPAVHRAQF